MIYHSIQDLLNLAKEYQIPLWEVVCRADMEERQVTKEQSFETMHRMYEAMKQADSAAATAKNCIAIMRQEKILRENTLGLSWKRQSKWASPTPA